MRFITPRKYLFFFFWVCCSTWGKGKQDFQEPVHIASNRQEAVLNENRFTFFEHVEVKQGTIRIHAEKVIFKRGEDGVIEEVTAFGNPATFSQMLEDDEKVFARALTIRYKPKLKTIDLEENAFIEQKGSQVAGDLIYYSGEKENIIATSATQNRRVQSVFSFQPEEKK